MAGESDTDNGGNGGRITFRDMIATVTDDVRRLEDKIQLLEISRATNEVIVKNELANSEEIHKELKDSVKEITIQVSDIKVQLSDISRRLTIFLGAVIFVVNLIAPVVLKVVFGI